MRKNLILGVLMLLLGFPLSAQVFRVEVAEDVPEAARAMLQQRFQQMLTSGGLQIGEDGAVLSVTVEVTDRMETAGSIPQVAVVLNVKASKGDLSEEFVVKGKSFGSNLLVAAAGIIFGAALIVLSFKK